MNKDGTLSEELPYFGKMTMKDSIKRVLDSKGVTAYVLPLSPLDPNGYNKSQLTNMLQQQMQEGLAELHARVLRTSSEGTTTVL